MNDVMLDAAVSAARSQADAAACDGTATRLRIRETLAARRGRSRRRLTIVGAVLATMFGSTAFAYYADLQVPWQRSPRVEAPPSAAVAARAAETTDRAIDRATRDELAVRTHVVVPDTIEPAAQLSSEPRAGETPAALASEPRAGETPAALASEPRASETPAALANEPRAIGAATPPAIAAHTVGTAAPVAIAAHTVGTAAPPTIAPRAVEPAAPPAIAAHTVGTAAPIAIAPRTVSPAAPPAIAPSTAEASEPTRERKPAHDPELAAYRVAHRAHFSNGPRTAALAAWDAYLAAYPHGALAIDARFSRALVLIELRRWADARAALQPFADAPAGSYRQADAAKLLAALPR